MDYSRVKKKNEHPRESANIFSLITFGYTRSIFKLAYERDLEENDLYEVIDGCNSSKLGKKLEKRWNKEKNKKNPKSVYRILWNMFWLRYLVMGVADLSFRIFRSLLEPKAFENLVAYFGEGQKKLTKNDAYYNAGIVIFFSFSNTLYWHNLIIYGGTIGIKIRTCFSAFLYRKILKLSPAALSEISFGNIVTLITKDVQTFEDGIWFINDLWIGLIHSSLVCYLLYVRIGVTTFAGVLIFFGIIPLQVYFTKILKKLRIKTCKKTDQRLEETQEALSMIRIIKMYTWEDYFIEKINLVRKLEINKMLYGVYLKMVVLLLGILVSKLGMYILVMAYVWMDNPPDSSIIFFIMSNYSEINWVFGYLIPDGIGRVAEFMSALERLDKVLIAEEIPTARIKDSENREFNPKIELENVTICMGEHAILKNVSLKLKPELTLITGPVGSGKSSLLKTILQEFPLTNGEAKIDGKISYASQDPWLFASSIKQNILFGEDFLPKRYQEVIRVCALEYDFSLFEEGDETILTDNGQNLSKGQQARVNLARAIYKDCDIYLLDDCLTSLDNHVSDFIFQECIKKFLRGKFCIVVSQTERHLNEANCILILKDGEIEKIIAPAKEINKNIYNLKNSEKDSKPKIIEDNLDSTETQTLLETEQNMERKKIFKETLKQGSVSIQSYKKYVNLGGGIFMIIMYFIGCGFYQFTTSYSEKLLTNWIDDQQKFLNIKGNLTKFEANATFSMDTPKNESTIYLNLTESLKAANNKQSETFTWYYGTMLTSFALQIVKTFFIFDFCRRASIKIHIYLIKNIFNAVMVFFDTHYIGVILNRLSQDLVNMDENLSYILSNTFDSLYYLIGSLILIISVNYYFIFYIGVVTFLLGYMGHIYLPFGRSMKRLEVATRSPILGHLNSTFRGLTTIRACRAETILINEFDRHHDVYTSSHYTLIVCQNAYGFFAKCLTSFLVTFVIITFIFQDAGTTAGGVGLALSQIFGIGFTINWVVSQYTELESMMTSVERVFEYTNINTENQTGSIVKNWPENGVITYENVSLTYNKTDIILNNLSFDVFSKQKIGIVGRTGAGKSSIISTIFRLYDIGGKIQIDGTDIKTIPLKYLRKNLAIIPQDPVLFTGTIRSNLDPFGEFTDEDLWKSLKKVNLTNVVTTLDIAVSSRSCNFSLGQKQMICVARAILTKAKIVILDEATANMDQEAETVITNVIKENFAECTVLTIAHRLQSIIECDKVMVLDRGEIKEYDSPSELLRNKDGYFYKMVQNK